MCCPKAVQIYKQFFGASQDNLYLEGHTNQLLSMGNYFLCNTFFKMLLIINGEIVIHIICEGEHNNQDLNKCHQLRQSLSITRIITLHTQS